MAIKFTYAFNPGTQDFDTAPKFVSHWLTCGYLGAVEQRISSFPPIFFNIAMVTQNFYFFNCYSPRREYMTEIFLFHFSQCAAWAPMRFFLQFFLFFNLKIKS